MTVASLRKGPKLQRLTKQAGKVSKKGTKTMHMGRAAPQKILGEFMTNIGEFMRMTVSDTLQSCMTLWAIAATPCESMTAAS